jgi:hypothetical protein
MGALCVEKEGVKASHFEAICMRCAKGIGNPPVLNRLPSGKPCKACADRVLDAQPGIFHAPWAEPAPKMPSASLALVKGEGWNKPSA